jgi:uncharacterized protein (DUF983 family)
MEKRSKIQAILANKCPHCREGDLFEYPAFHSKFTATYKKCPNCGITFEIEPAFFQGAMYIGYGFSVALFVLCGIISYFTFHDPEPWVYMAVIIPITVILMPLNFRYSRTIYLYLFSGIEYQDDIKPTQQKVEEIF